MMENKNLRRKISKPHRNQIEFFAESLDERLADNHIARIIWSFVEELDLSGFDEKVKSIKGYSGRPAIDSRILFSLWLLAYNDGIGSARKIDKLCQENDAYRWLTGGVSVNYHTIADFRTHNTKELEELFAQCLAVLVNENLIDPARIGVDGTKIRAKAKSSRFHRKNKLERYLKAATRHIQEIDRQFQENPDLIDKKVKAEKKRALQRQEKCKKALSTLEELQGKKKRLEKNQVRVSITEPEARVMRFGGSGAFAPAYNVQIAASLGTDVILAINPTQNHDDSRGLLKIMKSVKKNIKKMPQLVVTDEGYSTFTNLKYMNRLKIEHYTPLKTDDPIHTKQITKFFKDNSTFDTRNKKVRCPRGKEFRLQANIKRVGAMQYRCVRRNDLCENCSNDKKCFPQERTKHQPVVNLNRKTPYHEDLLKKLQKRMENPKAKILQTMRFSSEIVNARVKANINLTQFNVQGLEKVRCELLLAGIAHNFSRLISLRKQIA